MLGAYSAYLGSSASGLIDHGPKSLHSVLWILHSNRYTPIKAPINDPSRRRSGASKRQERSQKRSSGDAKQGPTVPGEPALSPKFHTDITQRLSCVEYMLIRKFGTELVH